MREMLMPDIAMKHRFNNEYLFPGTNYLRQKSKRVTN
jgi:hypothetical protein